MLIPLEVIVEENEKAPQMGESEEKKWRETLTPVLALYFILARPLFKLGKKGRANLSGVIGNKFFGLVRVDADRSVHG